MITSHTHTHTPHGASALPSYPPVGCGGDPTLLLKPIQQGSQCSTASGALSSTHQHPTWLVSRRARALLSHATRTLATGRVRQRRLHTGNNPRPCGRARSSPARRVIPCAGHWRGCFNADIATKQERPSICRDRRGPGWREIRVVENPGADTMGSGAV